jgi:antitoxin PrlF
MLSTRGQLVIPKQIRQHLGLKAGDRLEFVVAGTGEVVIRPATAGVRALRGMAKGQVSKPITIEAMNRVIRERN